MAKLLATKSCTSAVLAACSMVVAASLLPAGPCRAQESARFPALKAEQLTPEQKQWAVTAPPRSGRSTNPPYHSMSAASELDRACQPARGRLNLLAEESGHW
jgi:hypothetical protein